MSRTISNRLSVVFSLASMCFSVTSFAQYPPRIDQQSTVDDKQDGILRRAALDIDDGFVRELRDARRGTTIEMTLFDDVAFAAKTTRVEQTKTGFNWYGTIPKIDIGDVTFSFDEKSLVGTVWLDAAAFNIHRDGNGGYVVDQIDRSAFQPTGEIELKDDVQDPTIPLRALNRPGVVRLLLSREAAYQDLHARLEAGVTAGQVPAFVLSRIPESGAKVDVLIAMTREAADWLEQNEYPRIATMQNLVARTNQAFSGSGIATQLNYFGSVVIETYSQAGDITLERDLRNLRGIPLQPAPHADLAILHDIRDAAKVDIVTLLVHYPKDTYPGRACGQSTRLDGPADFVANPITADGKGPSDTVGFNVVNVSCAVLGETLTHEIGHTFGAAHDHYRFDFELANGIATTPALPGGHGHFLTEPNVRTVMAYQDFCVEVLGHDPDQMPCPVIPRFSNPQQTYSGSVLGLPVGFLRAADNAAIINLTARTVANFRHAFR